LVEEVKHLEQGAPVEAWSDTETPSVREDDLDRAAISAAVSLFRDDPHRKKVRCAGITRL